MKDEEICDKLDDIIHKVSALLNEVNQARDPLLDEYLKEAQDYLEISKDYIGASE